MNKGIKKSDLRVKELTRNEKKVLSVCAKYYKILKEVPEFPIWTKIHQATGFEGDIIRLIKGRLEIKGFLDKKKDYLIDTNNFDIEDIKNVLKEDSNFLKAIKELKKNMPNLKIDLETKMIVIALIIIFGVGLMNSNLESSVSVGEGVHSGESYGETVYIKDPSFGCYPVSVRYGEYRNESMYEDKDCTIPYNENKGKIIFKQKDI